MHAAFGSKAHVAFAIALIGKLTIETGHTRFDDGFCALHAAFIPGDDSLLAVSDDGCGTDAETRSRLFEPFFTTKEMGKGTGLGLATVFGIIRQNNRFIAVYSEPGQGTKFRIYLCPESDRGLARRLALRRRRWYTAESRSYWWRKSQLSAMSR